MSTFGVSLLEPRPFMAEEPMVDLLWCPSMQAMAAFDAFVANKNSDGPSVNQTPSFKRISFESAHVETVLEPASDESASIPPSNQLNDLIGDNLLHYLTGGCENQPNDTVVSQDTIPFYENVIFNAKTGSLEDFLLAWDTVLSERVSPAHESVQADESHEIDLSKFQQINIDDLFVEYGIEEFLERIKKTDEASTTLVRDGERCMAPKKNGITENLSEYDDDLEFQCQWESEGATAKQPLDAIQTQPVSVLDRLSAINIDVVKFEQNLVGVFADFGLEEFLERVTRTEKISSETSCNKESKSPIRWELYCNGFLNYAEGTSGGFTGSESVTPTGKQANEPIDINIDSSENDEAIVLDEAVDTINAVNDVPSTDVEIVKVDEAVDSVNAVNDVPSSDTEIVKIDEAVDTINAVNDVPSEASDVFSRLFRNRTRRTRSEAGYHRAQNGGPSRARSIRTRSPPIWK